ncbi:30S ribosomal protein S17 [Candidatus Omnitrophota bacterium]
MESRSRRKEKIGIVVNDKLDKTIAVRIDRTTKHPIYKRVIRKSNKVMAHDEKKEARIGNRVRVQETKPKSKSKRWRLVEVLK